MTNMPAPENILNMIFCNCKNVCKNSCSCRKAGLYCSALCRNCQAVPCTNEPKNIHDDDFEEISEVDLEEELEIEEI